MTTCKERGAGSTQQNSVAATATGVTLPQVCRVEIYGVHFCNSVVVCVFCVFSHEPVNLFLYAELMCVFLVGEITCMVNHN